MTNDLLSSTSLSTADDPRQNFSVFLRLVWEHLNLPKPTPVQFDIADYLQHGPKRAIIEAFRGVGKSWITSAFVIWLLLRDPQFNILVVSASKQRADDFTTFTLRLIHEMPLLAHLIPQEGQRQSKIAFDVGPANASHAPSVKSVGVMGQITGSRADVIIADDVEVVNNSATQMMRDKLAEIVKEFDAVVKPGGRIIYLGTPQTEQSIYNKLPERGYQVRIWPARFPKLDRSGYYADRLAPKIVERLERDPTIVGKPVDARRFTDLDLKEREASYGRSGFALQFMLDTRLSDSNRYPLRLSDLVVMSLNPTMGPAKLAWSSSPELCIGDLPAVGLDGDRYYRPMYLEPKWLDYEGVVMAIDPAGRGKDETGYAIVASLHGYLFLLAAGGFLGGYDEKTLQSLSVLAKTYKVNHVVIEANFGDGMYSQLLKPVMGKVHPCEIEEVKHNTQKEKRIVDVLEPVMNQHRLVVDEKLIRSDFQSNPDLSPEEQQTYQLFYQMTRITREKGALRRDDRLDALAIAVAYWAEAVSRDTEAAAVASREAARDKALEDFIASATGQSRRTGWIQLPFGRTEAAPKRTSVTFK